MNLKNRFTCEVIHSGDFESMKELVLDAINKGAKLHDADLRFANLQGANLQGAYLRGADLQGADLRFAKLHDADLQDAKLHGVNLRFADLWRCAGNRREVKSMFISEIYPITYTSEYLQIGCELHKISEWWSFDDDRIRRMDCQKALDFWAENKEFIKMTLEKYPATPTN